MKQTESMAQATAQDAIKQPDTVQRWALLFRAKNGTAELSARLFSTEQEAQTEARFWAALRQQHETAEVVTFNVPTRGAPVPDPRDLLP
ncbi:MAG: hypothetical protein NTW87_05625 [Planctomycetota bacterium]|nr:hypothetical protein [Planctomycetota bacterium]